MCSSDLYITPAAPEGLDRRSMVDKTLWELCQECWQSDPKLRPTCEEIELWLEKLRERIRNYVSGSLFYPIVQKLTSKLSLSLMIVIPDFLVYYSTAHLVIGEPFLDFCLLPTQISC